MPPVRTIEDYFCNLLFTPIYFYQDLLSDNPPYKAQAVINMVAEAIARVGFLHLHTAFLPGTVNAWIDSVIGCIEDPPPSKLEPQRLFFFEYHPLMGRWVTCPFYHYIPVLHKEFYLDELNQADSPFAWDSPVAGFRVAVPVTLVCGINCVDKIRTRFGSRGDLARTTFPLVRLQEDPFLHNTAMRLNPLQDFLYLAPQTDESTFRDILDTQIGPYAQVIAEIGILSVSVLKR
ncbi:hypothetical protein PQX77_003201 [Marasmius sp. AFHP31]|nr:hypothetical protein PQX77_003201 [Marasmius sp. AFHP31]